MNPADYVEVIERYDGSKIGVSRFYTEPQTRDHPGTYEADFDLFTEQGLIVDIQALSWKEINEIHREIEERWEYRNLPDQGDYDD
jgi:hypothetical protein